MRKKEIIDESKRLKQSINAINRKLSALPEGRVSIIKRRDCYSLSAKCGGKKSNNKIIKKYVSLNSDAASEYATKYYLEKLKHILEEDLNALINFDNSYNYNERYTLIDSIPEKIKSLVKKPFPTKESYIKAWAKEKYTPAPMPFDERFHYSTANGERVRSRAEVIIAGILSSYNIPYKYEAPFDTGHRIVYPDFTILSPVTGEEFFIEYFGLMDSPDYAAEQFSKIREYDLTKEGGRFIYFFEYGDRTSMNVDAIKNIIQQRVLKSESSNNLFDK